MSNPKTQTATAVALPHTGGAVAGGALAGGPPAKPVPLYFVHPVVDYALIGGLSIVTFIVLRLLHGVSLDGETQIETVARTSVAISLAAGLMWVCNWPHFAATSYRLYHSLENIRQYPITALVVPWVVLAFVVGSFVSPNFIAPFFVKFYLIWSPYHFSGQTVGITLIYARRAGFPVSKWARLGLSTFVFSTFITQNLAAEIGARVDNYYGIAYPTLGVPAWCLIVAQVVMWSGGVLFLAHVVRWCVKEKRLLPPIVLLPAVTQYVWFVYSVHWLSFVEFVPFFHSLQYMLIAWSMQLKEKMDLKQIEPSIDYVVTESLLWGALIFLGGGTLFYLIPTVVASGIMPALGMNYAPLYSPTNLMFATGIIGAGVQVHHFFVDGVIWKLKRKTVASPLMVNLLDLIREPAPATADSSSATPSAGSVRGAKQERSA